jgi:hypothetical protein
MYSAHGGDGKCVRMLAVSSRVTSFQSTLPYPAFNIHFIILLPCTLRSPKCSQPFGCYFPFVPLNQVTSRIGLLSEKAAQREIAAVVTAATAAAAAAAVVVVVVVNTLVVICSPLYAMR